MARTRENTAQIIINEFPGLAAGNGDFAFSFSILNQADIVQHTKHTQIMAVLHHN